jgi:dTDP-L-rhamnose 4-epimerase
MRILVTGGAGFIGSHLVGALVDRGDEVVVIDSLEPQVHGDRIPSLPEGVELIRGSVADRQCADAALAGVEAVVHLAAAVGVGQSMYEIERYVHDNTLATASFLERVVAERPDLARLVVASSMSIYGEGEYDCPTHGAVAPRPRPDEQLLVRRWECLCPQCGAQLRPIATRESKPLIPTSVYAVTKRDHEELCHVVGSAYGVPTVALRFFNVYGPGQALSNPYTGVAAIFSSRLLNRKPPLVFEDGQQSRDFIHVSDIVAGILLALESDAAVGQSLNLGTGRATSINEVAALLADALGVGLEPERPGTYRTGDVRHCYADPARAHELLGFTAAVRLENGITELVEWLASQTAEDRVDAATAELTARRLAR